MSYRTRIWLMERVSKVVQKGRRCLYNIKGYSNVHKDAILESRLNLDRVYPQGIHIGKNTLVASGVTILTHEHVKRDPENPKMPYSVNTYIGENCFIGINAIILPGVKIGDQVLVGAGAIVTKDIPSNSIVVGNPAKVVRTGIKMDNRAILINFIA